MKATRRNFMAGAAAIAVTGAPPVAIAAEPSDPFLAALAEYDEVHAIWLGMLKQVEVANAAARADSGPAPSVSFNGQTEDDIRTEWSLDRFFQPFAESGRAKTEAKANARAQVTAWRAKNAAAHVVHRTDELQATADEYSEIDSDKLDAAFATVPTTRAGFVAYLDLIDREWEYLSGRTSCDSPVHLKAAFLAIFGDVAAA